MSIVVGTSGHIDHGKTTLIRALTGIDTDRLAEEKARGITIDIGFAHTRDAKGNEIAFVDVPGHERFVHNMLAGASGLDAVMLIVAADEGVMPQTREHLAICDLLGIRHGLIVLTRIDLADPELIELSREDVRAAVRGTFLESAPVLPVSAVTGAGMDALRGALGELPQLVRQRDATQPFRFPVDRSFTMKGFGTVVTGTVVSGQIGKDEPVWQYPQRRSLRIRGLQIHGRPAERVFAGQRAAINVAGVEKSEIARGDQLAAENSLLIGYLLNVELRLLKDIPRDLTQRTRVRLHLGTREVIGRLVLLERPAFAPGETQLVQLRLEAPVASRHGDRFIIRNYSPVFTLGGGRVIDPAPSKSRRVRAELSRRLRALAGDDPLALVEEAVWLQSTRGIRQDEGYLRTGLSEKTLAKVLAQLSSQGKLIQIDPADRKYVHRFTLERIGTFVRKVLDQHHRQFPEREGMSRAELAGKMSTLFNDKEVHGILTRLGKDARIEQNDQLFRNPGHEKTVSGQDETLLAKLVAAVEAGGGQPARRTALFEACGVDEKTGTRLLKLAAHEGRLVRVRDDLYYTPPRLQEIAAALRTYLAAHGKITVIDFKDLIGVTRKHAVDLLEHYDAERVTIRLDNERVLRQSAS